jgi:hypothetical protein
MFLKRILLACAAALALASSTVQASPERLPMPREVFAKAHLKNVVNTVHGPIFNFSAHFSNLQGRRVEVETRFCTRSGDYLTFERNQELIFKEKLTISAESDLREVEFGVSPDQIKGLFGTEAREIYVTRIVRDAVTKELLATPQVFSIPNKLKPQAALAPRS